MMVMSRLHLICGNCGCNDEWNLSIERDFNDITSVEPEFEDEAILHCKNCGTMHFLSELLTNGDKTNE